MTAATAEVPAPVEHHRAAVKFSCPDGHVNSSQAAAGAQIKCCRCAEDGTIVLLTVPERPGDQFKPKPPVHCRACSKQGTPDGKTPVGWMSICITTDPDTDPKGRDRRILWPYCSPACAIAALENANGRTPRRYPDAATWLSFQSLMTEPVAGRYGED